MTGGARRAPSSACAAASSSSSAPSAYTRYTLFRLKKRRCQWPARARFWRKLAARVQRYDYVAVKAVALSHALSEPFLEAHEDNKRGTTARQGGAT